MEKLHIIFDGPPGPTAGRFVECETSDGRSVNAGEWAERKDGLWELVIPRIPTCSEAVRAKRDEVETWCVWTKTGRRPSFFHPSREKAEAEAERLAAKCPGKKFMVMQVVSKISFSEQVSA